MDKLQETVIKLTKSLNNRTDKRAFAPTILRIGDIVKVKTWIQSKKLKDIAEKMSLKWKGPYKVIAVSKRNWYQLQNLFNRSAADKFHSI